MAMDAHEGELKNIVRERIGESTRQVADAILWFPWNRWNPQPWSAIACRGSERAYLNVYSGSRVEDAHNFFA